MASAPRSSKTTIPDDSRCPPDCKQDRVNMKEDIKELFERSVPRWIKLFLFGILVSLIGALFTLLATTWTYASETYATKDQVQELKSDLKERMDQGFERILDAIDKKK